MTIEKHHQAFLKVVEKYKLDAEHKAEEVAAFLTHKHGKTITPKEFANKFNMDENDAVIFLTWIHRGVQFKESNIDPNKK